MLPGVYRGISNDDYHGGPGDSKSGLDLIRKSPALYRAVKTGKKPRKSTKSQMRGTAIHAMTLEPALVAATYALPFIASEGSLATIEHLKTALSEAGVPFKQSAKKGELEALAREHLPDRPLFTDERAAYDAENEGKVIIDAAEWDRLENMLAAIRAHPAAMKLLRGKGEAELSCYWHEPVICPLTGEHLRNADGTPAYRLMRCRPDWLRYDGIIVDLKSTSPGGGTEDEFARSLDDWRYFVQHPMYLRGTAAALEAQSKREDAEDFAMFKSPREFVFIVVEHDACVVDGVAMGVAVYRLGAESVAMGLNEMREDIATLHACDMAGKFPGYSERIEPIELPPWAFSRAAERAARAAAAAA